MTTQLEPPPGVTVRRPTLADADGVARLLAARDAADFGQSHQPGDVAAWWREEPERLASDSWIALEGARVVGYARLRRAADLAELEDESAVHPDLRARGIGSHLLDLAEHWAREQGLARIHASVVTDDGRRLLEGRGYRLVRYFWRMEIELETEPRPVDPPDGIVIRPHRLGDDDRAVHELHQDAFDGHWGFVPAPLERWLHARTRRSDYDPELWQLALEGDRVAGFALCFGDRRFGWVLDLAVGKQWRGRGLGLALLTAGFRELWRKGHTHVGLEVDSENESGATRLYERAGMRVTRRYATHEKRLEEGT